MFLIVKNFSKFTATSHFQLTVKRAVNKREIIFDWLRTFNKSVKKRGMFEVS